MLRAIALCLLCATPALATVSPLPPPGTGAEVTVFEPPPREASCAGGLKAQVVEAATLHPRLSQGGPSVAPALGAAPAQTEARVAVGDLLQFNIDADGRPLDIRRADASRYANAGDVTVAALASWRFASGAPASDCQIALASRRAPLEQARRDDLFELIAFERRNTPSIVRETVSKAGDCGQSPRRVPKTISYPDLRRFNDRDLNPAWAAVVYDVDAEGVPRNVKVETQGGDPALADVAAASIADSRFQPGRPVKACYGTFSATPRDTPAPPRPTKGDFKRPDDNCHVDQAALNLPVFKNYPPAFAKQKVGGWAYLRFDVAPWGQIGNIQVVDSQPSAAFGEAARSMLWSAKPKPPPEGYRGCLAPVFYTIPESDPLVD